MQKWLEGFCMICFWLIICSLCRFEEDVSVLDDLYLDRRGTAFNIGLCVIVRSYIKSIFTSNVTTMHYAGKLHKQVRISGSYFEWCFGDLFIIHEQVIKMSFKSIIADFSSLFVQGLELLLNLTKYAYYFQSIFALEFLWFASLPYAWKNSLTDFMILLPFQDYQCCPQNSYLACHSNRLVSILVSQRDHIMSYSTELH